MRIVTFGEIMGRLTPPGFLRLRQAVPGPLEVTFAGAEANVAASLALLGASVRFITALPRNPLADACVGALSRLQVDTDRIIRTEFGRLGLYFLETGANQRPSQVIYDREGSAISLAQSELYDWPSQFADQGWFHITGITPALSPQAAISTLTAVRAARAAGWTISCDLNFRKKLWRWEPNVTPRELAERTMRQLLPLVDLVIANEEDCSDVLGIRAEDTDVHAGRLAIDHYPDVARQLIEQFPNVARVAITLRESLSASHNRWGGMLYDRDEAIALFAPRQEETYQPYSITNIVDRVGAGDAFSAGLIFALTTPELGSLDQAIRFAAAASCLAHSIVGDFNFSSRAEIEALMAGAASGRVIR